MERHELVEQLRFPPGYRFVPTEEQLIDVYLRLKIEDERLPLDVVKEVSILDWTPDRLVDKFKGYGENKWYFFTKREQSSSNKEKEPSRKVRAPGVTASWKATGSVVPIMKTTKKAASVIVKDGENKAAGQQYQQHLNSQHYFGELSGQQDDGDGGRVFGVQDQDQQRNYQGYDDQYFKDSSSLQVDLFAHAGSSPDELFIDGFEADYNNSEAFAESVRRQDDPEDSGSDDLLTSSSQSQSQHEQLWCSSGGQPQDVVQGYVGWHQTEPVPLQSQQVQLGHRRCPLSHTGPTYQCHNCTSLDCRGSHSHQTVRSVGP